MANVDCRSGEYKSAAKSLALWCVVFVSTQMDESFLRSEDEYLRRLNSSSILDRPRHNGFNEGSWKSKVDQVIQNLVIKYNILSEFNEKVGLEFRNILTVISN